jgi:photosystem II stability/assembly factor-like uncharacterized protein
VELDGGDAALRTSWRLRDSGNKYWLYSIVGTPDGKQLWAVGDFGTILESDDGGATWATRNSGTERALFSVLCTPDGKHLWAVGQFGTILESDSGG